MKIQLTAIDCALGYVEVAAGVDSSKPAATLLTDINNRQYVCSMQNFAYCSSSFECETCLDVDCMDAYDMYDQNLKDITLVGLHLECYHAVTSEVMWQIRGCVTAAESANGHLQGPQFSAANFAKFHGAVCQIPWLTCV